MCIVTGDTIDILNGEFYIMARTGRNGNGNGNGAMASAFNWRRVVQRGFSLQEAPVPYQIR
jgi:hypothetical protein